MDMICSFRMEATVVANTFIDQYMAAANGEYVKVYLYLLRHQQESVDIDQIADALNHTEADVKRALSYWEKLGVLKAAGEKPGKADLGIQKEESSEKEDKPVLEEKEPILAQPAPLPKKTSAQKRPMVFSVQMCAFNLYDWFTVLESFFTLPKSIWIRCLLLVNAKCLPIFTMVST